MIVRISGEGQYRLDDSEKEPLNELEKTAAASVEGGDEAGFAAAFASLLDHIRSHGVLLGDADLEGSDVIVPPADISFQEAGEDFTGEGLIPD